MSIVNEMKTMRAVAVGKADEIMNAVADNGVKVPQTAGALIRYAIAGSFLTFQLELLEASQEGVAAPKPDPMEAAAIDAGYIKDVRDKPEPHVDPRARITNHYFYPQDISEAQEGDIWHDLYGRPHFCLGDGWIEARGFKPNCGDDQLIAGECHNGQDFGPFNSKSGDFAGAKSTIPGNSIEKFRLVKLA